MAGLMLAKVNTTFAALCHALVYSLPFLLLSPSAAAIATIAISQFLIDRFRLARLVAFAKNKVTDRRLAWADCKATGFPSAMPAATAFWLMIVIDNTMHLTIKLRRAAPAVKAAGAVAAGSGA